MALECTEREEVDRGHSHAQVKEILPDFIERALSKISKLNFLHLFVALL